MEARQLHESEYEAWNDFVDQSPQGSLFSKTWYLEALDTAFTILGAFDNGSLRGGIVCTRDRWGYAVNPVLGKYLGILFYPFEGHSYTVESNCRDVQRCLLTVLRKMKTFEYTFHPAYTNWLPFHEMGYQQTSLYTYRIALQRPDLQAALLADCSSRLRNKIQKALRESRYDMETTADFAAAMPLLEATYARQSSSLPYGKAHMTRLLKVLEQKKALTLITSVHKETGETAAVLGLFHDVHSAYLILNAVDAGLADRGVNEALIYHGMLQAGALGLRTFDFEGSMIPSIESFYRQFGGVETTYFRIWRSSAMRTLRRFRQRFG